LITSVMNRNDNIGVDHGVMNSPNFFSFHDLMNKIEVFYGQRNETVELIFDSSPQFNRSYELAFERMKHGRPSIYEFPGKIPLVVGYQYIERFKTGDSAHSSLLQCSDIVSSAITATLCDLGSGRLPRGGLSLALLGLPLGLQSGGLNDTLCSWIVSRQMTSSVMSALSEGIR